MVALQALAKYGAATYSEEGSTAVTVTSLGGLNKEFTVDQRTRLLYQEERLSEVPGEYTIRAQGQSCVLAQVRPRDEACQAGNKIQKDISSTFTSICILTNTQTEISQQ